MLKKKRNAVSPAAQSLSKHGYKSNIAQQPMNCRQRDAWKETANPSSSQISDISPTSKMEPNSPSRSATILPGSITDFLDEIQAQPQCVMKTIAIDEESLEGTTEQEDSWLRKLGLNTNRLAFLNPSSRGKDDTSNGKRADLHNNFSISLNGVPDHISLKKCVIKEDEAYIPYKLAKLYITKIEKDMQQMKMNHMKNLKDLQFISEEIQEQAIMTLKNQHHIKMNNLKSRLHTYQHEVDKKNSIYKSMIKTLEEENSKLMQEKSDLQNQVKDMEEKNRNERTGILEIYATKMDIFHCLQVSTLKELQLAREDLITAQKLLNLDISLLRNKERVPVTSRNNSSCLKEENEYREQESTHAQKKEDKAILEKFAAERRATVIVQSSVLPTSSDGSRIVEKIDDQKGRTALRELQATLERVNKTLHQKEEEITNFLQIDNSFTSFQITITTLLHFLVNKILRSMQRVLKQDEETALICLEMESVESRMTPRLHVWSVGVGAAPREVGHQGSSQGMGLALRMRASILSEFNFSLLFLIHSVTAFIPS
ncbi:myosin-6-like [Pleurodeles waltl]|uniref:myosin-6-like n=1 Tax=Pleurodeles waltl TaxID=8319 RepID=UPI003709B492